jgi:RimJ/RimL family protein N-acetyltransferase
MEIRKSRPEDFDAFYQIKCDPAINAWSGHTDLPDYERLKAWYHQALKDEEKRLIYLFFAEDQPIGYFYVDFHGSEKAELACAIVSTQTGKGLGTIMMALMLKEIKLTLPRVKDIFAWVLADNIASEKMCLKNGFVKPGITKDIVHLGVNQKQQRFEYSV